MNRVHAATLDLTIFPVFATLSASAGAALAQIALVQRLERGEFLYQQGEIASGFYLIAEGGVRLVETTYAGQDVHLKVYGTGDLFGLLAISGSYPHPSGAQAIDSSTVIRFPGEAVRAVIGQCPELGLVLVDLLVAHVHHAHGRIRQLAAERVERRLARALLHFAHKFGSPAGDVGHDAISIAVSLSQQDLADFIGATVETVNRTLKQWEERGIIRRARQHIDVLAADLLAEIAEEQAYMGQQL